MNLPHVGLWTKEWAKETQLKCEYFDSIESTNQYAKSAEAMTKADDDVMLVLADNQTKGRGRGSAKWLNSDAGTSLLSSWSFPLAVAPQPILSPLVGLSLFRSVSTCWPKLEWSLKAPNDLYLETNKIAGLLIETTNQNESFRAVIGFGMNVFAHPQLERSGDLASRLSGPLEIMDWKNFLGVFWGELTSALQDVSSEVLSKQACTDLLEALNRFPLLDDQYLKVLPQGSLQTAKKIIDWSTL